MATPSKKKGNKFESRVCECFSSRFESLTGAKNSFVRNPYSGSATGGKNAKLVRDNVEEHKNFGDIMTPMGFKFVIECKHYKDQPTFSFVVKQSIGNWDKWINQVETDSKTSGKKPLLIIKYNLVDEVVFVNDGTYTEIQTIGDTCLNPVIKYKGWWVYRLNEFIKLPDKFFFKESL